MTITDTTAPVTRDLRALTDEQLAGAWNSAEVDDPAVRAMFLAEFDQRTAAERTGRARAAREAILAEGYDAACAQYLKASGWTRGSLLSDLGKRRVTDEMSLWTGDEATAMRYASEELRDFWMFVEPRITPGRYARQRGAHARMEREAARDRAIQSWEKGNDHEHDGDAAGAGLADPDTSPFRHEPAAPQAPQAGPRRAVQRGGPDHGSTENAGGEAAGGRPGRTVQPGLAEGKGREDMGLAYAVIRAAGKAADKREAERGQWQADHAAPEPEQLPQIPPGLPCPLDTAREFASQILWMPGHALDALVLIAAASHVLDAWQTVPRILATSDQPQSGKTTLLDALRMLASAAWDGTGATSYALRARFNETETPFVIIDEISDVFGQSGRRGAANPIGLLARHGYRRTAHISMAVDRTAEDVPAFAFMAFGGLRTAIPADIRTRAIVFKMAPCPASVRLPSESTDPEVEALAATYRANLHAYVRGLLLPRIKEIQRRFTPPHPAFKDRKDQVFRALYITALAADEAEYERYLDHCDLAQANGRPEPAEPALDWGGRALAAFKALMLDASDLPALLPAQAMLRDAAEYCRSLPGGTRFAFAADIRDWLRDSCPEPLWDSLTDRRIELLMAEALGESQVITLTREDGSKRRARGFAAGPVTAAWDALELTLYPPAPAGAVVARSMFDDLPLDDEGDHGTHSTSGMSALTPTR